MGPAKRSTGFTLVEVLIALAVLAVALAAVMRLMGQAIDLSAALRDRTIALWVAQDRLTLHYARGDWPAVDTTEGDSRMGERVWRWQERVSTTQLDEMRRIDIEVRTENGVDVLARLSGFLRRPGS